MKCTFCDSELAPGATICDACGAPVKGLLLPKVQEEIAPAQQAESFFDAFAEPEPAAQESRRLVEPAVQAEPAADAFTTPAAAPYEPQVFAPSSSGERVFGMPTDMVGNIALGLGGAGCLLSALGCGWIFSILGLVAGFLSLKTSGRRNGTIGLVLSGLGLLVTLLLICAVLYFITQGTSTYFGE